MCSPSYPIATFLTLHRQCPITSRAILTPRRTAARLLIRYSHRSRRLSRIRTHCVGRKRNHQHKFFLSSFPFPLAPPSYLFSASYLSKRRKRGIVDEEIRTSTDPPENKSCIRGNSRCWDRTGVCRARRARRTRRLGGRGRGRGERE